ncbi:MAG: aldehyde dehydrogenase family protein [archaeon]
MKMLISTNPAKNYETLGNVVITTDSGVKEKVRQAKAAKKAWKDLGTKKRIALLKPIYNDFKKRKDELSTLITKETGKTIKESIRELDFYLDYFRWFLENGKLALKEQITHIDQTTIHKIVYEPIGVAAVITPWNFPFGIFVWGVIPNLIVGNTVVFKTSEECPLTGKLIEDIMRSHRLPDGAFIEIYGAGDTGRKLAKSDIDFIWFTGSTEAGKELYRIAADRFIKVILELGGSNPAIIFEDADISHLIDKIYAKRYNVCGQTCDSLKRLIVHESKYEEVIKLLKKKIECKIVGDPEKTETDHGSLAAKRQLELLESQVQDALDKGAKIIIGAKRPENIEGAYYLPTILTGITKDMRIWHEEVFGPVLPMISFRTEQEAIDLANETKYGLGAIIFTKDKKRAERIARNLESGTIEINGSDHWLPCNPFGGFRQSGIGKEHGIHGFHELCRIKLICEEK